MIPLLLKLRWREGAIGALVLACVYLALQWKQADADLKKAKLSYENPQIRQSVKEVRVEGPVRIVYRTIIRPSGENVREHIILKEPVTTETELAYDSIPVSLDEILTKPRSDRWLLSFGINRFSKDINGKALLAGYGFKNRLDLMAGVIQTDHPTGWIFATLRF